MKTKNIARRCKKLALEFEVAYYTKIAHICCSLIGLGIGINSRALRKVLVFAMKKQSDALYKMIVNGFLTGEQSARIIAVWLDVVEKYSAKTNTSAT